MPKTSKFIQKDFILENKVLPKHQLLKKIRTAIIKDDSTLEIIKIRSNYPILRTLTGSCWISPVDKDWSSLFRRAIWKKGEDPKSYNEMLNEIPSVDDVYEKLSFYASKSDILPVKIELNKDSDRWLFKNNIYSLKNNIVFTDDQISLLILEDFDEERIYFEKLKNKLEVLNRGKDSSFPRPSIPEAVRIEVWRRDNGKCVSCDSRGNLEYDHIIPISKGGGNTTRNIELLCESCNRSKGAKIQ